MIVYLLAIIYMTLLYRNGTEVTNTEHGIIDALKKLTLSYENRKGVYNNILLFIPFGTILYKICPRLFIIVLPIICSVLIEIIQFYTGTGYCELLDIIANGVGGTIGYYIAKKANNMKSKILLKNL